MALRAELIGPYCLFLVMSSVCADLWAHTWAVRPLNLGPLTARMVLLDSTAAALVGWGVKALPSAQGLSVNN